MRHGADTIRWGTSALRYYIPQFQQISSRLGLSRHGRSPAIPRGLCVHIKSEAKLLLQRAEYAEIGTTVGIPILWCEIDNGTRRSRSARSYRQQGGPMIPESRSANFDIMFLSRSRAPVRSSSR